MIDEADIQIDDDLDEQLQNLISHFYLMLRLIKLMI